MPFSIIMALFPKILDRNWHAVTLLAYDGPNRDYVGMSW